MNISHYLSRYWRHVASIDARALEQYACHRTGMYTHLSMQRHPAKLFVDDYRRVQHAFECEQRRIVVYNSDKDTMGKTLLLAYAIDATIRSLFCTRHTIAQDWMRSVAMVSPSRADAQQMHMPLLHYLTDPHILGVQHGARRERKRSLYIEAGTNPQIMHVFGECHAHRKTACVQVSFHTHDQVFRSQAFDEHVADLVLVDQTHLLFPHEHTRMPDLATQRLLATHVQ